MPRLNVATVGCMNLNPQPYTLTTLPWRMFSPLQYRVGSLHACVARPSRRTGSPRAVALTPTAAAMYWISRMCALDQPGVRGVADDHHGGSLPQRGLTRREGHPRHLAHPRLGNRLTIQHSPHPPRSSTRLGDSHHSLAGGDSHHSPPLGVPTSAPTAEVKLAGTTTSNSKLPSASPPPTAPPPPPVPA